MRKLLIFILTMSLLAAFGNQGGVKLVRLKNVEKTLREENRLLAEHNMTLIKEIHDLKDPGHLERYIRDELGFVQADEILYESSPQTP